MNHSITRHLLHELSRRRVRIWAENGQVHYDAPKDVLDERFTSLLRRHRDDILQHLEQSEREKEGPWLKELTSKNADMLLYAIPAAGVGPSAFRHWRDEVPPGLDVVVVHIPGREDRLNEDRYTDIIPLADRIAGAIRDHADRPFIIFGHSAGALIGREVAKRVTPRLLAVAAAVPPNLMDADMSATDDELVAALVEWGYTPQELLDDPDARSLILLTLRADLSLVESCHTPDVERLNAPIISFLGTHDSSVSYEDCAAWSEWTSGPFEIHTLDGGHFFPLDQGAALFSHITAVASAHPGP
ncbi:alpha/beta fold hydrolase [Streptomyces griseofuscus]|uniref:alpha/beta fold hydrolase n=1 Tax=Streptomyces griseofuscus TaxID=146922 RepID=UPI003683C7E0